MRSRSQVIYLRGHTVTIGSLKLLYRRVGDPEEVDPAVFEAARKFFEYEQDLVDELMKDPEGYAIMALTVIDVFVHAFDGSFNELRPDHRYRVYTNDNA